MSTLIKEWLQQTIAELEEERDATPGAVNEDAAKALAAMKIALASLEAEAVAWRHFQETPTDGGYWILNDYKPNCSGVEPLYTAPPAPFVPDEINVLQAANLVLALGVLDNGIPTVAMKVWNACRAAMLQGAEQTNYRAIVERIAEIIHGKVTDIDLLTVTVKSMKDKLQK